MATAVRHRILHCSYLHEPLHNMSRYMSAIIFWFTSTKFSIERKFRAFARSIRNL